MDGTRHRFPGKEKGLGKDGKRGKKNITEEEAVNKASRKWIRHFVMALMLCLISPIIVLTFLPSPVKPREYPSLTRPAPFEGPLSLNNDLAFSDKLYENQLFGPESLVIDGENIYTGTMDGWVNHLYKGEVRKVVRFGQEPCGGYENENTCGRPLGLRMDKNGFLVVIDAYHGLFRVNTTTGEYETLYKATTPVNGKPSKMLNDLDIDDEGRIYFTDSSTEWHRNQFFNIMMEGDSTGRLLMFDPKVKLTKHVVGNLMFPNGVQLTPDGSSLLLTEFSRARIHRYDLKSKKLSVWADGLPGFPDNIRFDAASQTYWVAMAVPRFRDKFSPIDYMIERPWLRGMIAKVVTVSNVQMFRNFLKLLSSAEPKALAVEFDTDGHIISSIQDRKGTVIEAVSEVHFHDGLFYMGSYHENFLAQLDWKKVENK